jgi:hypothetical protein
MRCQRCQSGCVADEYVMGEGPGLSCWESRCLMCGYRTSSVLEANRRKPPRPPGPKGGAKGQRHRSLNYPYEPG